MRTIWEARANQKANVRTDEYIDKVNGVGREREIRNGNTWEKWDEYAQLKISTREIPDGIQINKR